MSSIGRVSQWCDTAANIVLILANHNLEFCMLNFSNRRLVQQLIAEMVLHAAPPRSFFRGETSSADVARALSRSDSLQGHQMSTQDINEFSNHRRLAGLSGQVIMDVVSTIP
jgi:hypothetical protein